jgi:ferrous iron transport protein A
MAFVIGDLGIGESGIITGYVTVDKMYRKRLLAMGLTKGSSFTVIRKAPFGDPVEIKIKDYNLTLRKDEASAVQIDKV